MVGALLGAQPGESLRLLGRWSSHPQFGRQFEVDSYTTVLPATIQGIQRYLGSGLIKGIGPVFAERIVDHFGVDTLSVIEDEPARLVEVPGLGPKRTAKITAAWEEQKAIKEVMVFLQGVGVSTSLAVRIYKKYADASRSTSCSTEPYRLAADVWGIGFKTADTIAQAVGIPHDSPERVKAGLQYTLSEATDAGPLLPARNRSWSPRRRRSSTCPPAWSLDCLDDLVAEEGVVRENCPPGRTGRRRVGAGGVSGAVPPRGAVPGRIAARRLLRARRPDAALRRRRLGPGAGLAAVAHRHRPGPRAGTGRPAGAHVEGRRADRRARLRQELHRPLDRRTGRGEEGEDHCWSPRPAARRNASPS